MGSPPNIVWLVADHVIHANHGTAVDALPLAQAIGRDGVQFRRAYTSLPICSPARASMLTGLYPHAHGLTENDGRFGGRDMLGRDDWMIQSALNAAGYRCAWFGKWHLDNAAGATEHGFEGFSLPGYGYPYGTEAYRSYLEERGLPGPIAEIELPGESGQPSGTRLNLCDAESWFDYEAGSAILHGPAETHEAYFLAHLACEWLRTLTEEPFFVRVDPWGPHPPYLVPEGDATEPMPRNLSLSPNFFSDLADRPQHHRDYRDEWRDKLRLEENDWARMTFRAFQQRRVIEQALLGVVEALDAMGLSENTIVIYTADHGDAVGSNGGACNKGGLMVEETMRVPLSIRGPGIVPGADCDSLVSTIDLTPTLLARCGVSGPEKTHGRDLSPILERRREQVRDGFVAQHNGLHVHLPQRAYFTGDWKLILQDDGVEDLYNLQVDPAETENLAANPAYADVCERVRISLSSEMQAIGDTFSVG